MDSMRFVRAVACALALVGSEAAAQSRPEPVPGTLPPTPTLADALATTLVSSPVLQAFALEERAREAAALQAAAWPNPELGIEVEDVAGTGDFSGTAEAQTTLGVLQLFELGGERAARRDLAESERSLAAFDYAAKRIEALAGTADAFVDALAAQEQLVLADEALRIAREGVGAARDRTREGVAAPADETRAELALAGAELARARAGSGLLRLRERLAARTGQPGAAIERVLGSLAPAPALPDLAALRARVAGAPGLARFESERALREASLAFERARRIPDVTLNAGVRRIAGPDETTVVFGAAVPIPLWDRNAGAIAEAQHRLAKVAREREATERALDAELVAAHDALAAARAEALALERSVIPRAEEAVARVRAAHRAGALSQHDRIETELVLQEVRVSHLRALAEAHHHAVALDRLTASLEATAPRAGGVSAAGEEGAR